MVTGSFKDTFLEYLAYGPENGVSGHRFGAGRPRRERLFTQLLDCVEVMPKRACVQVGLPAGASYADAARKILR